MNNLLKKIVIPIIIGVFFVSSTLGGATLALATPGDEITYYLLTDHLGSVDVVLDEQGNVVERRDYLPYGHERATDETINAPATDPSFTGKDLDDETGLHYYEARYYDSNTGRFVSPDPLVFRVDQMKSEERNFFLSDPQNLNAYTYAKNNPLKYVDPDGEVAILAALVVATAFVATFMSSYQNVAAPDINSPPIHTRSEVEILGSMAVAEVTGAVFGYGVGRAVQKLGQFGFKTIAQLRQYRELVADGMNAQNAAKNVMKGFNNTVETMKSSPDIQKTLDRIAAGERHTHRNDGSIFRNDKNLLPEKAEGYYHEYVHPSQGVDGPGAQRIVTGKEGEIYYTPDHYKSFKKIE